MSIILLMPQGGVPPPPPTVSTGAARYPGTNVYPDPNLYPAQGQYPLPRLLFSTDPVSADHPTYTDITTDLRDYSTSRGRGAELEEFGPGTCTLVLDDRDRSFDPHANAAIRPFNRVWLLVEFAGEVRSRFKGYVQSWTEDYPNMVDATATIEAADELSALAAMSLDTTDPPRDSYQALVSVDAPFGYWDFNEDSAGYAFQQIDAVPLEASPAEESAPEPERRVDRRRAFPSKGHRKRG